MRCALHPKTYGDEHRGRHKTLSWLSTAIDAGPAVYRNEYARHEMDMILCSNIDPGAGQLRCRMNFSLLQLNLIVNVSAIFRRFTASTTHCIVLRHALVLTYSAFLVSAERVAC